MSKPGEVRCVSRLCPRDRCRLRGLPRGEARIFAHSHDFPGSTPIGRIGEG